MAPGLTSGKKLLGTSRNKGHLEVSGSLGKSGCPRRPVALTIVCLGALPFCFVYAGPWEMRWCCAP